MRNRILALLATLFLATACGEEDPVQEPEPLLETSPFRYPLSLWDQGLEGATLVLVHVTSAGTVDSVVVSQTSGHPAFDSAAVAGARDLQFRPARQGDRRIDRWVKLPVRFRRDAGAAPAAGT